jgi:hypothetical protein
MTTPVLIEGEHLLWSARPRRGLFFRVEWLAIIPFLAVGCWMSSVTFYTSFRDGEWQLYMLLFLVPVVFVIVTACYLIGLDLLARLKVEYHLTDLRVIVATRVVIALERTVPLSELREVGLREKADGSGTVTFRPKDRWIFGRRPPAYLDLLWFPRLAFEDIEAARHVQSLVVRAMLVSGQRESAAA